MIAHGLRRWYDRRGTSGRRAALTRHYYDLHCLRQSDVGAPPLPNPPSTSIPVDQRVATSIRQLAERRRHRFSWINEWKETADANGRALGIELILRDWFYAGVLEDALVLTIDRAYFSLTGGLERWLYRIVRKHGGRQDYGWSFDFGHLHAKSGSLSPLKHFVYDIRDIVRRQPAPGYSLTIERSSSGAERLSFKPSSIDLLTEAPRRRNVSQPAGDKL